MNFKIIQTENLLCNFLESLFIKSPKRICSKKYFRFSHEKINITASSRKLISQARSIEYFLQEQLRFIKSKGFVANNISTSTSILNKVQTEKSNQDTQILIFDEDYSPILEYDLEFNILNMQKKSFEVDKYYINPDDVSETYIVQNRFNI
ncbi:hypothetical protein OAQ99_07770 [Candidatus Kapabacteria bacterium]|nr:hypothetical protein [Candidatus Kapabacteria bacterium]